MILLRRSVLMVLVMLVLPSFCLAGWVGPKEIITGAWGSGDKEFGYKSDEIKDYFPTTIKFFQDGKILIYDPINTKINIYDNKGVYAKTITTSGIVLSAIGNNQALMFRLDDQSNTIIGLFDIVNENWSWVDSTTIYNQDINYETVFVDNNIFLWNGKKGYKYSLGGIILKHYTSKPIELGNILLSIKNNDHYTNMLSAFSNTYSFSSDQQLNIYSFDDKSNLFMIERFMDTSNGEDYFYYKVLKLNKCSKKMEEFEMPKSQYNPVPDSALDSPTWKPNPIIEYGEPIISQSGDLYSWARTADKYKVLKWTWQDDPNTPSCPDAKIKQAACDNTSFMKTDMRLTAADLAGKNKEDLRLMRNEVYARHGKTFQSADLQKYFSGKCWYKADSGYSDALLTPVDRENIRIVQDAEKGR